MKTLNYRQLKTIVGGGEFLSLLTDDALRNVLAQLEARMAEDSRHAFVDEELDSSELARMIKLVSDELAAR